MKRAIGIPGDKIHLEHGVVYLNGVAQNEPYAALPRDDGKPEVNCCYPAFVLRTRIGRQKMPIAGTPASGSVAQGIER